MKKHMYLCILMGLLAALHARVSSAGDPMPWEVDEANQKKSEPSAGRATTTVKPEAPAAGDAMPWEKEPQPAAHSDPLADLRRKAESGDIKAQFSLALKYFYGKSVDKDREKAAEWFRTAAEGGHVYAQNNLGWCYEKGEGVAKDHATAFKWYKLSAENGYDKAKVNVSTCYELGYGVDKDFNKAFSYSKAAAASNDKDGLFKLAHCYEKGVGTDVDLPAAIELYETAQKAGRKDARAAIDRLTKQLAKQVEAEKEKPTLQQKAEAFDKKMDSFVDFLDSVLETVPEN